MANKFHDLLKGLEYAYGVVSEKDIVDGLGNESESERAPFYEPFIVNV
jgi:hypothetical protein